MEHKRALVISGGGAKGAFAAGAVKYLMVDRELSFDLIIGTSTGALISPLVATQDIADLLTIYENVEDQDVLSNRPDLLAFLLSDALNGTEPLEQMIERFFGEEKRYQRLVNSPIEMFVTVVNLQTGRVEYGNQHRDSRTVLLKKILASASVPVMMPPVKVGKYQYVDGGVKEIAPLSKAIDEGATHVISIILSPNEKERTPKDKNYSSSMDILKRTLDLLTEEIVDNDVKIANLYTESLQFVNLIKKNAREQLGLTEPQIRKLFTKGDNPFSDKRIVGVTVIQPHEELMPDSLSFDPVKMREMVDMGYAETEKVVAEEIRNGTGFFEETDE